jgi:thioredoxin-like negative regulator of GroEL
VVDDKALDLQAYVAKLADGRGIVSFRGTQPEDLADWIDDLEVRLSWI